MMTIASKVQPVVLLLVLGVLCLLGVQVFQSNDTSLSGEASAVGLPRSGGIGFNYAEQQPQHSSGSPEKVPCTILERRYVSSPLEQKWFDAADKWKAAGNGNVKDMSPYCRLLTETQSDILKMLDYIKALMESNSTLSEEPDADTVLSHFVISMDCGSHHVTHKEHIESLVGPLRHPFSVSCPPEFATLPNTTDIFDRSYVLLAGRPGQVEAAPKMYYLDAGAGIGYLQNANQYWMIETYAARGIHMDRTIFWEARQAVGNSIFDNVPESLFPAFTFYNIPAATNPEDGRCPLAVATRLARPEDFVSMKLDIDAPSVEKAWLNAILGNWTAGPHLSRYAEVIDELFWEHHFDFHPIMKCCWGSQVDLSSQLVDSMRMFIQLRQMGIRSHYWQ